MEGITSYRGIFSEDVQKITVEALMYVPRQPQKAGHYPHFTVGKSEAREGAQGNIEFSGRFGTG